MRLNSCCRTPAAFLWAADVRYAEPNFFPSEWAGETFYSAVMRFAFLPRAQLELTGASGAWDREAASKSNKEC